MGPRLLAGAVILLSLALSGCDAQCDRLEHTYAGTDAVPPLGLSADEIASALGERHAFVANWQSPRQPYRGYTFPPVSFSGSEELAVWVDLPSARFRVTAEYQPGDGDCADGSPQTKATLHMESASGLVHESVLGQLTIANEGFYFQGRVSELSGSARSYRPRADRWVEFNLAFDPSGGPRKLELTMHVDGDDNVYVFLSSD